MRIDRIEPSRRRKDRVLVFLEGGDLLRVTEQELLVFGLRPGLELPEQLLAQVEQSAKRYLQENPETADKLEADIRRNFDKLMSNQSRIAAKAAGRAVDVSADDFDDAD